MDEVDMEEEGIAELLMDDTAIADVASKCAGYSMWRACVGVGTNCAFVIGTKFTCTVVVTDWPISFLKIRGINHLYIWSLGSSK